MSEKYWWRFPSCRRWAPTLWCPLFLWFPMWWPRPPEACPQLRSRQSDQDLIRYSRIPRIFLRFAPKYCYKRHSGRSIVWHKLNIKSVKTHSILKRQNFLITANRIFLKLSIDLNIMYMNEMYEWEYLIAISILLGRSIKL